MRTCLSFLVVENMRNGHSPKDACRIAIHRLLALKPNPYNDVDKMHKQLVVGIVAMDREGNIGGASTLCEGNLHRGKPFFPISVWRRTSSSSIGSDHKGAFKNDDVGRPFIIEAGISGV